MKRVISVVALFWSIITPTAVNAQCAMCRTQVVNNVSAGETTFAAGLNIGILYLFFTPYLLIGLIIFLWFKYSRYNEKQKSLASRIGR